MVESSWKHKKGGEAMVEEEEEKEEEEGELQRVSSNADSPSPPVSQHRACLCGSVVAGLGNWL